MFHLRYHDVYRRWLPQHLRRRLRSFTRYMRCLIIDVIDCDMCLLGTWRTANKCSLAIHNKHKRAWKLASVYLWNKVQREVFNLDWSWGGILDIQHQSTSFVMDGTWPLNICLYIFSSAQLQCNCRWRPCPRKPSWNTTGKLAAARQIHCNPTGNGCFKLYLRQGGFCKASDNGELCWRHTGWFSPFKWGHQIPAVPLCLVWGQTFYLEAFLNMSRGRNVTHGRAVSPKIFQSLKNFWADITSSFSKAD